MEGVVNTSPPLPRWAAPRTSTPTTALVVNVAGPEVTLTPFSFDVAFAVTVADEDIKTEAETLFLTVPDKLELAVIIALPKDFDRNKDAFNVAGPLTRLAPFWFVPKAALFIVAVPVIDTAPEITKFPIPDNDEEDSISRGFLETVASADIVTPAEPVPVSKLESKLSSNAAPCPILQRPRIIILPT